MISDKSQPVSAAGRCGALPAVRQAADVRSCGDHRAISLGMDAPQGAPTLSIAKPEIELAGRVFLVR
jgi:hypothetical protein